MKFFQGKVGELSFLKAQEMLFRQYTWTMEALNIHDRITGLSHRLIEIKGFNH